MSENPTVLLIYDAGGRCHSATANPDTTMNDRDGRIWRSDGNVWKPWQPRGVSYGTRDPGDENKTPTLATEFARLEKAAKLSDDAATRKAAPMALGLLDYFPDALADVARLSKVANDRHNPGQPMHWSRDKSTDHADCIIRHMVDRTAKTKEGDQEFFHATMVAWRALAQLQLLLEAEKA